MKLAWASGVVTEQRKYLPMALEVSDQVLFWICGKGWSHLTQVQMGIWDIQAGEPKVITHDGSPNAPLWAVS